MLSRIALATLALVLVGMYAVRATGADREKAGCCGVMSHDDHAAASDACPMASKPTTRQAAQRVYTCPMDPDVVSNKPGKCPKCGMNLVPKQPEKPQTDKKPADSGHAHNH